METKFFTPNSNRLFDTFIENPKMASGSQDLGGWEKYTKGIGSKLLAKMGFEPGKGLGKNQQGITAPIEVNVRPGLGAIGAYDFEAKAVKKSEKEKQIKVKQDDTRRSDTQPASYKSRDRVKKVKVYEKSIDEIILEGIKPGDRSASKDGSITKMKILDMTGPDQRILSGLSQLHQSKAVRPKDDYTPTAYNTRFDVIELKHNIDRLLRITENKLTKCIQDNERDVKSIDISTEELGRLERLVLEDELKLKQIDQYDQFVKNLDDLDDCDVQIEDILVLFENYYTENLKSTLSKLLRLDELILTVFNKRLQKELRFWKPFTNDKRIFDIFTRLQKLVVKQKTYDILLWNSWNTSVFRAIQGWHSMKNFNEPVTFFEQWLPILPKWLFEYQIQTLVIARILRDVEEWSPQEDSIPVSSWIFPWHSVILENDRETDLTSLFEPIYQIIRQKLGVALTHWQPNVDDRSVFSMLYPWRGKFSDSIMQNFLDDKIVPKLEIVLAQISTESRLAVNNDSVAKAWQWSVEWRNLFSAKSFCRLLERAFFPNWLIALHQWLTNERVDFLEVHEWYFHWKKLFVSIKILNNPRIVKLVHRALLMVQHRADLNIGLKIRVFYYEPKYDRMVAEKKKENKAGSSGKFRQADSINFKQMVEKKANDSGILFMPISNRFQEGRQVYQFGQHIVYMDNQVLFLQKFAKGVRSWNPIGIHDLIEMCSP